MKEELSGMVFSEVGDRVVVVVVKETGIMERKREAKIE